MYMNDMSYEFLMYNIPVSTPEKNYLEGLFFPLGSLH